MGRSSPDQVDGDLQELDPAVLALMRGELARIDGPSEGSNSTVGRAIDKRHLERQRAQAALRDAMRLWGGWRKHLGEDTR